MASDRESINNYFPNLAIEEFKNITDQITQTIEELMKFDHAKLTQLQAAKARRLLKKLVIQINQRWLNDDSSTSDDEKSLARGIAAKILLSNKLLKEFIDNRDNVAEEADLQ